MKKVKVYLKQSEGLVTCFANKLMRLRRDIFLRTQVAIIAILFFLCFLYLVIIFVSTYYLHIETAGVVVKNITETIALGEFDTVAMSDQMVAEIKGVRTLYLLLIGGTSLMVTILFGYTAARIALAPTRNALLAQKQFIGNVAHELRTPLSILKTNNELMLLDRPKDPAIAETVKSNIEEIDRISGIINNLMTLNVLARSAQVEFGTNDLIALIHDTAKKLRRLAYNRKIEVVLPPEDERLFVWGNESALAQIIANVLKNAIVYTPARGTVTVVAGSLSQSRIFLDVIDTGVGIPSEKLERIFEPFYRVESSRTRRSGGSGLGLAIVSELVKLHKGKISVMSTPNIGTKVHIELPTKAKEYAKKKSVLQTDTVSMDFSS